MPPTHEENVELVADFVKRLRRVALHPLVRDDQGDLVRELMEVTANFLVRPEGTSSVKFKLVDEVSFESLAVRIRPLTLDRDRVSYYSGLKALHRIVAGPSEDYALRLTARDFRAE